MGHLSELALANIQHPSRIDPATSKRNRVLAALGEQRKVLAAKLEGNEYEIAVKRWRTTIDGSREQFDSVKRIRAWFFEMNGGWYVQCKYGSKALVLDGKNNSVFCEELAGLGQVLDAFEAALKANELDAAIEEASKPKAPAKAKGGKAN